MAIFKKVEDKLSLLSKTAIVKFVRFQNAKISFYAEAFKSKRSVCIALSKKDVKAIKIFLDKTTK